MLRDIRELTGDPEAYAEELRRRWGGLLSYRYLGRSYSSMNVGPVDDTVAVRHDMRDPAGGLLLSVFGIVSPDSGLVSDLEAVPNPVVHTCQVLDPGLDVSRIEIVSEGLKRGARMAYSRSVIRDADRPERILAFNQGQGVTIGVPPEGLEKMQVDPIEVVDSPELPPLWQVFGCTRRPDGHWVLPELAVELASPDTALHVGPQFVALETTARTLAAECAETDLLHGVSSNILFMARGKVGPFRTDGQAFRGADGIIGVRTELYDEGAGDKMVTCASHTYRVC
jgi:hypothetical protein